MKELCMNANFLIPELTQDWIVQNQYPKLIEKDQCVENQIIYNYLFGPTLPAPL